jgi:hypothetical protein
MHRRERGVLHDISADVSLLELFLVFLPRSPNRTQFYVLYVQYDVGQIRSFRWRTLGISRSQYIPSRYIGWLLKVVIQSLFCCSCYVLRSLCLMNYCCVFLHSRVFHCAVGQCTGCSFPGRKVPNANLPAARIALWCIAPCPYVLPFSLPPLPVQLHKKQGFPRPF